MKKGLRYHKTENDQRKRRDYSTRGKPVELTPVYCVQFGCGKVLNSVEMLYGNLCFNHSQIKNQRHEIDS